MYADYHVHSEFSDDSDYEMEQLIQDAIKKGITELCFTDHVDYGIKRDWDDPRGINYRKGGPGEPEQMPVANVNYPQYVKKIQYLQEKYHHQITIKLGLEFGMQVHTIENYTNLFHHYPFDFIILSIHEVNDQELWTQDFQRGKTQKEYNELYYLEMLNIVKKYKNYSVLGHMDLITRYDNEGIYDFKRVEPIIKEILKIVIKDGKGIEINTSSKRYGLKNTTPSLEILKLYKELGGSIITIGSDSHKEEHLGAYIKEAEKTLKEIGFEYICTFENMQPIYHEIGGNKND